jgi:hypothetical protein
VNVLKDGKRIFFSGLKDVSFDLERGELGSAKRKMGILEVNINKKIGRSKGFQKNFLKRSLKALKPLKKMI